MRVGSHSLQSLGLDRILKDQARRYDAPFQIVVVAEETDRCLPDPAKIGGNERRLIVAQRAAIIAGLIGHDRREHLLGKHHRNMQHSGSRLHRGQ